jgi:class 3 adenylate cyclase/tetratricopeptide (TPR) repeat protein
LSLENVAVLFTDMVGSTALASTLAPDAADELRREHFAILRQALAESGGTEVKNLGDGLMVVFASASAALSCGVAMQQGVDRDNRDRENRVGLRVGLSVGEVSREQADYFGEPVIEAARLCAICESGQILATDLVRGMAGRRNRHRCRALGELTLKGLPDPVETIEVLWEPIGGSDTGTAVPLPGRLAVRPAVGVVGREAEMQTMTDAAKRVASGDGSEVLLISGEAGLGKTTLVAEAARSAFDSGACVVFGHCEEDLATPYQLFAEALGHYVTHAPKDQLLAHIGAHGTELSRLVPALASRIPDLPPSKAVDSDTERYLLFAAVVGLLATTSQHQPVVLVLDDLQWADKGSLLLLHHLAASDVPMRLLIVGTYRDSELSNAHALVETLASLRRLGGVTRIEMVGFDDTGVMALMEAAAGHRLDEDVVGLAHAIYRETDGNPFFVSEVLRNLTETGAIRQDAEGRWVAGDSLDAIALPDSVREVIGARVLRLGKDAGRVLSVASVIGRDFDLDLLARVTRTSDDELLDILDAAAAVALVREVAETGRYSFAHALIQHTLYEDLGHNRRARAHRQVAEALDDLCGDHPGSRVGELARHWISATEPIDLAKAIGYSRQAGDAALAGLAPADALRYYAQALDLYPQAINPDPTLGIDLGIGLGIAQRQTGNPGYRDTLLKAARQAASLGDTDRLVTAALANNRGFVTAIGTIDADKVEVLETALERLSADAPDRALVLATLCQELSFERAPDRRQALADEAVAIAGASGDEALKVRVFNGVFDALPRAQALDWSADAVVRATRLGDPVQLFLAADRRQGAANRAGDIDEMDRCLEIMASTVETLNQPSLTWVLTFVRATRAQIAGDTDEAEKLATLALQIGTECGEPDAAAIFGAQLAIVSFQRGTMGELIPFIAQAAADNPGLPTFVAALATAYSEGDRIDEARHLLEDFATTDFDLPMDGSWITGMVSYSNAAVECRDPLYAGPLFHLLSPWADEWSTTMGPTAQGPVSHTLGSLATVLGRYDEADALFAHSAASSARANAKFFSARTHLMWGKMLAERRGPGDVDKARDLLTTAHIVSVTHGYGTIERRAAAALQLHDM